MSEHTPGPWVRGEDYYIVGPGHRYVADIMPTDRDRSGHYSLSPEDRANGRLISAAPDLLAACKAALAAIERLPEDALGMGFVQSGAAGFQYPIRDELADSLRIAIAKAEGRQVGGIR